MTIFSIIISDRPDSRSTDEDIVLSPPRKEPCVPKSHSTSRVPNTYSRSISNDRSKESSLFSPNRKRFVSGEGFQSPAMTPKHCSHPPNVLNNRPQVQARSLSASGTAEFYGRNNSIGQTGGQKLLKPSGTGHRNGYLTPQQRASGKNTWNGYGTGPRTRNRPNLFQSDLFGNKCQVSDKCHTPLQTQLGDCPSPELPDLASCIRQALELHSDAEKISHIELVIKQYELQRNDSIPNESVSLPYIHTGSFSAPAKSLNISKRKETGITKIPRPNFY